MSKCMIVLRALLYQSFYFKHHVWRVNHCLVFKNLIKRLFSYNVFAKWHQSDCWKQWSNAEYLVKKFYCKQCNRDLHLLSDTYFINFDFQGMAVAQKLEGGSSWPLYNIDYVDKPVLDLKVSKTSIPRAVFVELFG